MNKITFCGAQGTGKSTILNLLRKEEMFNNYEFITGISRKLNSKYNLPINEGSTDETQLLLFNKILEKMLLTRNFISDRGLLDVLSYTQYFYNKIKNIDYSILSYQNEMYHKYNQTQGLIIYFPILFPVIGDEFRVIDEEYRKNVDNMIKYYLDIYHKKDSFITMINGTPEERLKFLKECLKLDKYKQ